VDGGEEWRKWRRRRWWWKEEVVKVERVEGQGKGGRREAWSE
jgi:hypothetical protein